MFSKKIDTSQLDKLQKLLDKKKIAYERIDLKEEMFSGGAFSHHQLVCADGDKVWSVICSPISDGYEEGLLEFWTGKGDTEGWLSAEGALEMIKEVVG